MGFKLSAILLSVELLSKIVILLGTLNNPIAMFPLSAPFWYSRPDTLKMAL